MHKLHASKKFLRKYIKLIKRNQKLEKVFDAAFDLLANNPTDVRLKSHKVIAKDGDKVFSSRVTGDLRIIWRYVEEDGKELLQIISLIDIGGHEGAKKVYK